MIRNPGILFGTAVIVFLIFVAVFAGFIAPHDPTETHLKDRLSSPSSKYPLGTDHLGRCILSRIIYGTRISLSVGVLVIGASLLLGLLLGTIAGYYGGIIDDLIMRIVDGFLAFPSMFLALAIAGALGPSLTNLMIALIVVEWTSYARVVRGSILSIKDQMFVEAARGLGAGDIYLLTRHVLPNILSPLIVMATLGVGYIILTAAGLSFLGLGVQPPTPEWGAMLNDGRLFMRSAPHIMIFPGLAIMITVLAFNFLGDGLRDVMDPRLKQEVIE
ncbi:MAG: nickel ABC transporter permease [Candidatus Syntrophoarchaeum caldarius]|uniref:Nickel ABC transporter permease n=1 Tax=Candidatus Syntropharchaeum caldarium TaxID=1838285 RepID=A0A1F2PDD7_9EURY|nr:MAG: nickel ABC transporter permease [Candidatus Syntrophoarchaeum caldarius]